MQVYATPKNSQVCRVHGQIGVWDGSTSQLPHSVPAPISWFIASIVAVPLISQELGMFNSLFGRGME